MKYTKDNESRIQKIREQFATYQAQRDLEVNDMKYHLEAETDRMIEFAKERLHQKYIRDLDDLRSEIRRDNDIETALRKTVDRQHTALQSIMKAKSHKVSADQSNDSTVTEKNRRNLRRLQGLNTKLSHMNQQPK